MNGAARAAEKNPQEIRAIRQMPLQTLETLAVQKGELRAGIDEAVFELGAFPPSVEKRGDAAGDRRSEEGRRPFRQVSHGDGDAVALLQAFGLQSLRDRQRRPSEF